MVVWQFTIFSIIALIFLVFGYRRGYKRGQFKEFLWADILIIAAFLTFSTSFILNLLRSAYNTVVSLILTRLRAQGVAVNPETSQWNLDVPNTSLNHGRLIANLIIFFVIALISYAMVTGKGKPTRPGEKPASAKSLLGGVIGILSTGFFIETIFSELLSLANNSLTVTALQNFSLTVPSLTGSNIPFSGINLRIFTPNNALPLLGWGLWVPIIIAVMQFFYVLYVTFAKPPTVTKTQLRLGLIFFLAVSTIIIAIFAWQLNLIRLG